MTSVICCSDKSWDAVDPEEKNGDFTRKFCKSTEVSAALYPFIYVHAYV